MLDTARVIFEKAEGEDMKLKLSDVRLCLGETMVDSEQYEGAERELSSCLSLQQEILPASDRRIAETYFQLGRALNLANKFSEAAESYKKSVEVLRAKLELVKSGAEKAEGATKTELEKDVAELESLIPDILAKVDDCVESGKSADEREKAMQTENGVKKTEEETAEKPIADNITHLVRKPLKRKTEEETEGRKKAKEEEAVNGDHNKE
jgi:lipopolysaccharide biosynthesis regulator YciM